jgi:hypothetical protein
LHSGIRATILTSFLFFPIIECNYLYVDYIPEGGWFLSKINKQFSVSEAYKELKALLRYLVNNALAFFADLSNKV